jgi:hypothetical protein
VEQAEERALIRVAAADVEGRANVLLRQLGDADRHGVGEFSSLLSSSFFVKSICVIKLTNYIFAKYQYL